MNKCVNGVAITLALLGPLTLANAADLNLTSTQKQMIIQSVANEKAQAAPAGFQAKIGATIPQSMEIHTLPVSVFSQLPAAKDYEFAKLQNNEVLLVNPKDRQVAAIVMPQSSTTGQRR